MSASLDRMTDLLLASLISTVLMLFVIGTITMILVFPAIDQQIETISTKIVQQMNQITIQCGPEPKENAIKIKLKTEQLYCEVMEK